MIEKLIHTPEGELKSANPFLTVGTRGYYKPDPSFKWMITALCIGPNKAKIEKGMDSRLVSWLDRELKTLLSPATYYRESELTIVSPEDKEYFKVEGY